MEKNSLFANFGIGPEKEYFIEQLSMLLASGIPISSALDAITKEIKSGRLKKIIKKISVDVDAGTPIAKALEASQLFPEFTISLIRIGEQSGRLSENLKVVAEQQQKDREFRSKASSAMMYPLFVFSLTVSVGLGITWFILPRLASVFSTLKIQLPLITQWLIAAGTFLGKYGAIAIPGVIIIIVSLVLLLYRSARANFIGQIILFFISPIARLLTELELSRFGTLMGNLMDAGLPIAENLDTLSKSSVFYKYKKLYSFLHEKISEGNSFQKSFNLYKDIGKLIPVPIQQLIITGEQSGNLPETFKKIGQIYDEKTETTTKNLSVLFEPVLLVIVWLGVVAVALAVILPLYSLIGNLNAGSSQSYPAPIVVVSTPIPVATPSAVLKKITVLDTGTGFLNIRETPAVTAKILQRAATGDTFEFIQKQGDWYQVVLKSGTGWVSAAYVNEIK